MDRSKAAARTRLLQELSKTRHSSSPRDEDFATAGSFDIDHDAVIHSTAQMAYDHGSASAHVNYRPASDNGTEGSTEMSIELGRGHKKDLVQDDVSSNAVFNIGDDSLYGITATPPIKSKAAAAKLNGILRKEAHSRGTSAPNKSNEALKRTVSGSGKQRTLAEALGRMPAADDTVLPELQPTTTAGPRNSRFTRSLYSSAPEPGRLDPPQTAGSRQAMPNEPATHTATYTANSFILPDLPNIAELVSGTRKDGTPVLRRDGKLKSRFTSGTYRPLQPEHAPVDRVPIPSEEHAIYTSLQLLKEKVSQLEMEKTAAESRVDRYKNDIMELRTQLQVAQRRPDSAIGSDADDAALDKLRAEKARLQGSLKALQERFNRAEQKRSVSQITVDRVVQEREKLITQIGIAYHENEQLKDANAKMQDSCSKLQTERDELWELLEQLRAETCGHRSVRTTDPLKERRSSVQGKAVFKSRQPDSTIAQSEERNGNETTGHIYADDIALRIAKEVQKHRDGEHARRRRSSTQDGKLNRVRSRSRPRSQQQADPVDGLPSTARRNGTTDPDFTRKIQESTSHTRRERNSIGWEQETDNNGDMTMLSELDPLDHAALRKRIEEEYRATRHKRNASAATLLQRDETTRDVVPRKASLRDLTVDKETTDAKAKVPKAVRVQSPHSDDVPSKHTVVDGTDMSATSNISRRRRAMSGEGMTSAFIVPDITLHGAAQSAPTKYGDCLEHKASHCTICRPGDQIVPIPKPVPVSQRAIESDPDVTTATVRPAQAPPVALATVIKQLEDEITHLKLALMEAERKFSQHVPALSKRKRELLNTRISNLRQEVNRRMDQVYALYDVLEGHKQAAERDGKPLEMDAGEVEETLMSIGIDPAAISGRLGRGVRDPDLDDVSSAASDELPWEGLSDYESEQEPSL